jgi:3-hydroxyisobutyrate dehydrogenase
LGHAPEALISTIKPADHTLGWIGTGRMGYALVTRLLERGCDVSVYNRTRAKAEPLAKLGARIVDRPADLSDRDIVIISVADSDDFTAVTTGPDGVLSNGNRAPAVVVDSSTVSMDVSEAIRLEAGRLGTALLAAPVSGNPKVARAGRLSVAVSGPKAAFEVALPYLKMLGASVSYVGEGERARLVKICHNLVLGVVTQILAETTVLAERGGIARADYLDFLNDSVMGSTFSRYKTPALVNLDFTPTFTGHLLRKDFELGLEIGRQTNVPLPVSALVHQIVVNLIGSGLGDKDFASLLELEARGAGLELEPDPRHVADGLGDKQAVKHVEA